MLLFDGGAEPLASFGSKLSGMAAADPASLGVELHMNTVVTGIDRDGLEARGARRQHDPARGRGGAVDGRGRGAAGGRGRRRGDRRGDRPLAGGSRWATT